MTVKNFLPGPERELVCGTLSFIYSVTKQKQQQ